MWSSSGSGKKPPASSVSHRSCPFPRASVARHTAKLTPPATGDGPSWYAHVSAIATFLVSCLEYGGVCLLTRYNYLANRSIRVSCDSVSASQDPSLTKACSSASPFWRPQLERNASSKRSVTTPVPREPNVVVGAGYSHADMLKLDSMYVLGLEPPGASADLITYTSPGIYPARHHAPKRRPRRLPTRTAPMRALHKGLPRAVNRRRLRATSTSYPRRMTTGTLTRITCLATMMTTVTTLACRVCRI